VLKVDFLTKYSVEKLIFTILDLSKVIDLLAGNKSQYRLIFVSKIHHKVLAEGRALVPKVGAEFINSNPGTLRGPRVSKRLATNCKNSPFSGRFI